MKLKDTREAAKKRIVSISWKHGYARRKNHSPEYDVWSGIIKRCYRSYDRNWKKYGGRGISICPRWRDSFEAFLADMGPRPGKEWSIGRIDNDGNYEPGNCKWETKEQQNRNRRGVKLDWDKAVVIALRKFSGESTKRIAMDYGISPRLVRAVAAGEKWKDAYMAAKRIQVPGTSAPTWVDP